MGQSITAFDDERLELIIKGGKRVYGEGSKAVRYPITADILLRMVREINDDEEGVNLKTALCVGFAAFLRSGEFTWDTWRPDSHLTCLSRKHIVFRPDGSVILILPSSKTDPFHRGVEIYLAQSPRSPICPVAALHRLFHRYPMAPNDPLFTRPLRQPFSKPFFGIAMRNVLLNAGIPSFGYSGHSLRKGAAVTADQNGISRHHIQLLGRWKSDAVDTYIDERRKPDYICKILCLNARLHASLTPTSSYTSLISLATSTPPHSHSAIRPSFSHPPNRSHPRVHFA